MWIIYNNMAYIHIIYIYNIWLWHICYMVRDRDIQKYSTQHSAGYIIVI